MNPITNLEARLNILEAREAIRDVIDTYAHTLDRANRVRWAALEYMQITDIRCVQSKLDKDMQAFADLSTPSVDFDHPIGRWKGQAELVAGAMDLLSQFYLTQHHISNVKFWELDLEKGTARVGANLIATHVYKPHPGVTGTDILRDYTQMGAPYDLEFVRNTDGKWQMCKNHLQAVWFTGSGDPL
jgi:hypothetical protein